MFFKYYVWHPTSPRSIQLIFSFSFTFMGSSDPTDTEKVQCTPGRRYPDSSHRFRRLHSFNIKWRGSAPGNERDLICKLAKAWRAIILLARGLLGQDIANDCNMMGVLSSRSGSRCVSFVAKGRLDLVRSAGTQEQYFRAVDVLWNFMTLLTSHIFLICLKWIKDFENG